MQAATVVLAYLQNTKLALRSRAYEVLGELATQTLERLKRGQSADIATLSLKTGVAPDVAKEPSAWLSPHWATLMRAEPGWQEGMADEARRLGIEVVPKLDKSPGNPAYYRILASPIPAQEAVPEVAPVPEGGIYYTAEAVAAPGSWLLKAWRSGVVPWNGLMRWGTFSMVMVGLIATLGAAWLLLNGAARIWRPLSPADLAVLVVFLLALRMVVLAFRFLEQLFDLRLVMAPSLLTPFTVDNVTLELRPSTDHGPGELIFARYTSTCPICQGTVELFDGGKVFPDRVVGRCRRSGREHVFSFDHVQRIGYPLRARTDSLHHG